MGFNGKALFSQRALGRKWLFSMITDVSPDNAWSASRPVGAPRGDVFAACVFTSGRCGVYILNVVCLASEYFVNLWTYGCPTRSGESNEE